MKQRCWFVDYEQGNDWLNDGKSHETAFKTIKRALNADKSNISFLWKVGRFLKLKFFRAAIFVLLAGCSANYIIPNDKTSSDFNDTKRECEEQFGTKSDSLIIGDSDAYSGMIIGEAIHNLILEKRFRDCMKTRGYAVK